MKIENKIEWTRQHMPVLDKIRQEFLETQPLKGLKVGACLHLTKETAILLMTIQDAGAEVIACASNPLSTQDDVVEYLRNHRGMIVYGKKGMNESEYHNGVYSVAIAECDYVIDDGADLTATILGIGDEVKRPKGGLEETTTGINRIKNMNLEYPILAVNDADTKHLFDNVYGTGQSTLDGIIRATNILLAGKTFVVAGYGNCGKGLAQRAKGMGCTVIVTEVDPIRVLQAQMDGFEVMQMNDAAYIGDVFVTVTGSKDVITAVHLLHMKNGAIIANSGHFDVEIEMAQINKQYKSKIISENMTEYEIPVGQVEYGKMNPKIIVLSEGRLVNLASAEGHPSEVMDMSFANQLLGLGYLINTELPPGVHNIPKNIDHRVAELKAEAMGIKYDVETEDQINYRKQ